MITIVNYGLGNIQALATVYKRLCIQVRIAQKPEDFLGTSKIILPGVGSFDDAMNRLNTSGLRKFLDELVLIKKIPVLGICVGMQMLAESSEEGTMSGLGWIKGHVRKFNIENIQQYTHLPHMGWNDVKPIRQTPLLSGLEKDSRFYFLHSYYFDPANSVDTTAVAEYGIEFTAVVNHENIFGVQFHPEKSHHCGSQLLKNYAEL